MDQRIYENMSAEHKEIFNYLDENSYLILKKKIMKLSIMIYKQFQYNQLKGEIEKYIKNNEEKIKGNEILKNLLQSELNRETYSIEKYGEFLYEYILQTLLAATFDKKLIIKY